MRVNQSPYFNEESKQKNPLMIGSSGGGGHNSAINGVRSYLQAEYKGEVEFQTHQPRKYDARDLDKTVLGRRIKQGLSYVSGNTNSAQFFRWVIRNLTSYPVIPGRSDLEVEVESLAKKNSKPRHYIDMLLDACPAGYESAAIWNVLQRKDKTTMLLRSVAQQQSTDSVIYAEVKQHYLDKLTKAEAAGKPFTEVISTQVMALGALCDAVIEYNKTAKKKIYIHQYMTDLPTIGAVHFFNSLNALNQRQRQQIRLYGCGLNQKVAGDFLQGANDYKGIYEIPPDQNPMVRPGFKDASRSLHDKFNDDVKVGFLDYKKVNDKWVEQKAVASKAITVGERVASIMLGSQASDDTVEYVKSLLDSGFDKIFVFGGLNDNIYGRIEEIIAGYPQDQQQQMREKIIRLGNQSDREMMPIMTRSNAVVIRGGGLSVMEQMAMQHNPCQSVFIHHPDQASSQLTSGIAWEDENVNSLIKFLANQKVLAQKTSPKLVREHLVRAQFANCTRSLGVYSQFARHVRSMPLFHIEALLKAPSVEVMGLYYKCLHHVVANSTETKYRLLRVLHEMDKSVLETAEWDKVLAGNKLCALSKLVGAGGLSQDMFRYVVENKGGIIEKINSPYNMRKFSYVYVCAVTGSSFRYARTGQFFAVLNHLYQCENQLTKNQVYTATEIGVIKQELYKVALSQFKLADLHKHILKYPLPSSVAKSFKLDILEYQCRNLHEVFADQCKLHQLEVGSPTAENNAQIILRGIKYLIETSKFDTNFFNLTGDPIYFNDPDGNRQRNIVPHHMNLIYQRIDQAIKAKTYLGALADVKQIVNDKISTGKVRDEYRFFKCALEAKGQDTAAVISSNCRAA